MYVVRGNPNDVFPRIFEEWNVSTLTFETDIEPYAMKRDNLISDIARQYEIRIITKSSHTIYDPYQVLHKNGGKIPMQYQRFLNIVQEMRAPEPIGVPKALPSTSVPQNDSLELHNPQCYAIPTLKNLKVDIDALGECLYPGGETEALDRMHKFLKKTNWICGFEKPNTSPNSLEPSTTVLSPYLKFGCLSSRLFFKELKSVLKKNSKHTKPPVSLVGQLMWREFYYTAAAGEPNFDRMEGNTVCRQIPWQKNDLYLKAWSHGKTGYPFIDAIMRQLRQEGWIHHLARHAVACFLTRGDLWISWEEGQHVFEELLLDADWALNAGNWMWLSASAFFYQYFRVYSPVAFGKKTDKDGKYIRKYCPELVAYPNVFIYEPWKATKSEQIQFKCVLGKDYPERIVIHENVYRFNLEKMAKAYKKHNMPKDDSSTETKPEIKPKFEKIKKEERKLSPQTSPKNSRPKRQRTINSYLKKEPPSPQ